MEVLQLNGSEFIPTCLSVLSSGDVVVGGAAQVLDESDVDSCYFYDLKRWVGVDKLNFEVIKSKLKPKYLAVLKDNDVHLTGLNRGFSCTYTVKQLILLYIETLVKLFSKTNSLNIISLNVSVPADYKCKQRMFMKSVCDSLNFSLRRIINEPSAAAIYNVSKYPNFSSFLMYDFGGGTFDTSLIVRDGKYVTVADTEGDPFLGGRDIDNAISEYVVKKNNLHSDLSPDYLSIIKEECNSLGKTIFNVVDVSGKLVTVQFTQSDLEICVKSFLDRSLAVLNKLIVRRDIKSGVIFMVGGSSLLKPIQSAVKEFARLQGLQCVIDPELRSAVSYGCSMQHAQEDSGSMIYIDCNSHPLMDLLLFCNPRVIIRKPMSIPYTQTTSRVVNSHYSTSVNIYEGSDLFTLNNDWLVSANVNTQDHVKIGQTLEFVYKYTIDGILELYARNANENKEVLLPNSFALTEKISKLNLRLTQLSNIDEYATLISILCYFDPSLRRLLNFIKTPALLESELNKVSDFQTLYAQLVKQNKLFA
ncbi:heat shock 70-kDa protein-like protein [Mulberry crinivirus]|nr:heat shock 70-kDa protein-like protein [Mulberry crinivirus]